MIKIYQMILLITLIILQMNSKILIALRLLGVVVAFTCCCRATFLLACFSGLRCCYIFIILQWCTTCTGSALLFRLRSASSHSRSIPTGREVESRRRSTTVGLPTDDSRRILISRLCLQITIAMLVVVVLIGRFLLISLAISVSQLLLIL